MSARDGTGMPGTYKLASVLLQYPTAALFEGLDILDAAVAHGCSRTSRRHLARFLGWLRAMPPTEVAQHYVQTFDLRRRCALYLTYYRYGDTRKRGMAMLRYKAAYRRAQFAPTDDELPDYLPLVLEFAALAPAGVAFLRGCRADVELLRRALHGAGTPYADVVEAVSAELPTLGKRELHLVREHWTQGPPHEEVGI